MRTKIFYSIAFLAVVALGSVLRFTDLQIRPLHTDEAVHAIKFGKLLEEGYYRYDKEDYHGPTLNFLTLPLAWISSKRDLEEIDESLLRSVPAIFGIGLICLSLFFFKPGNYRFPIISGLLMATSPAFVFYSRYYIHEVLLVFFTYLFLLSVFKLLDTRKHPWLGIAGIALGLMIATKETWIVSIGVMLLTTIVWKFIYAKSTKIRFVQKTAYYPIIIAGLACLTGSAFFSSFFNNPVGIWDLFRAIPVYLEKSGQSTFHIHPWHYYLKLLIYTKGPDTGLWSEAGILLFSVSGFAALIGRKECKLYERQLLFIACFAIILFIVFSIIPYKTPWNMLGSYMGLILLAGYGMDRFLSFSGSGAFRVIRFLFVFLILGHIGIQVYRANFKYYAHPENPYVYAHTDSGIFKAIDTIQEVLSEIPEGELTRIDVIFPGHDYWPLPWYLRNLKRVGWWDHVPLEHSPAPLILISTELENELAEHLYERQPPGERNLYVPLFDEVQSLRPGVFWNAFITTDGPR